MNEQDALLNPSEIELKDWLPPMVSELPLEGLTQGSFTPTGADAGIYS